MKHFPLIACLTAAMTMLLAACEDSSTIGTSIIENNVEIVIDSTFTITGRSVDNSEVQSRTVMQLLGRLEAGNYGSISSDVVTQFISSQSIDTTGYSAADVDSVKLILGMSPSGFTGDSLVPMGIEVYPLTKQLPSPIYSNFDPAGYYDSSRRLGSTVYSAAISNLKHYSDYDGTLRYINIPLPRELGESIINRYITSPETFANPEAFTAWFPGFYIRNSWGSGRVINISTTTVKLYYHYLFHNTETGNDSIINATGTYLAVSPEVVTNNNIRYKMSDDLRARINAGEAIVAAPAGTDVEFTFPAADIIEAYRAKATPLTVVNTLTFDLPISAIANEYAIAPPKYILMVKKSMKDKFFAQGQLPDGVNSFYAEYNASTGSYSFAGMRSYLVDLLAKDEITADDTDFILTPVYVATETQTSYYYGTTSTTVTSIIPYVLSPVMGRIDFDRAKIKFTFSKQTL